MATRYIVNPTGFNYNENPIESFYDDYQFENKYVVGEDAFTSLYEAINGTAHNSITVYSSNGDYAFNNLSLGSGRTLDLSSFVLEFEEEGGKYLIHDGVTAAYTFSVKNFSNSGTINVGSGVTFKNNSEVVYANVTNGGIIKIMQGATFKGTGANSGTYDLYGIFDGNSAENKGTGTFNIFDGSFTYVGESAKNDGTFNIHADAVDDVEINVSGTGNINLLFDDSEEDVSAFTIEDNIQIQGTNNITLAGKAENKVDTITIDGAEISGATIESAEKLIMISGTLSATGADGAKFTQFLQIKGDDVDGDDISTINFKKATGTIALLDGAILEDSTVESGTVTLSSKMSGFVKFQGDNFIDNLSNSNNKSIKVIGALADQASLEVNNKLRFAKEGSTLTLEYAKLTVNDNFLVATEGGVITAANSDIDADKINVTTSGSFTVSGYSSLKTNALSGSITVAAGSELHDSNVVGGKLVITSGENVTTTFYGTNSFGAIDIANAAIRVNSDVDEKPASLTATSIKNGTIYLADKILGDEPTENTYKVVSGLTDSVTVNATAVEGYSLVNFNGSAYLTKVDANAATLYVDGIKYAGKGTGTITTEGYIVGYNAFSTLADAAKAAKGGTTIDVSGTVEAASAFVCGGNVTITTTTETGAVFDWGKDWMFVGRGEQGDTVLDTTVIFKDATITRADNNNCDRSIHISGAEKDAEYKKDGTVILDNSSVVTEYIINKNQLTVTNASTLTVNTYLNVSARPKSETPYENVPTAHLDVDSATVNVLGNVEIGNEGKGEVNLEGADFNVDGTVTNYAGSTINVLSSTLNAGTLVNTDETGTVSVSGEGSEVVITELDGTIKLEAGENKTTLTDVTIGDATDSVAGFVEINNTSDKYVYLYGTNIIDATIKNNGLLCIGSASLTTTLEAGTIYNGVETATATDNANVTFYIAAPGTLSGATVYNRLGSTFSANGTLDDVTVDGGVITTGNKGFTFAGDSAVNNVTISANGKTIKNTDALTVTGTLDATGATITNTNATITVNALGSITAGSINGGTIVLDASKFTGTFGSSYTIVDAALTGITSLTIVTADAESQTGTKSGTYANGADFEFNGKHYTVMINASGDAKGIALSEKQGDLTTLLVKNAWSSEAPGASVSLAGVNGTIGFNAESTIVKFSTVGKTTDPKYQIAKKVILAKNDAYTISGRNYYYGNNAEGVLFTASEANSTVTFNGSVANSDAFFLMGGNIAKAFVNKYNYLTKVYQATAQDYTFDSNLTLNMSAQLRVGQPADGSDFTVGTTDLKSPDRELGKANLTIKGTVIAPLAIAEFSTVTVAKSGNLDTTGDTYVYFTPGAALTVNGKDKDGKRTFGDNEYQYKGKILLFNDGGSATFNDTKISLESLYLSSFAGDAIFNKIGEEDYDHKASFTVNTSIVNATGEGDFFGYDTADNYAAAGTLDVTFNGSELNATGKGFTVLDKVTLNLNGTDMSAGSVTNNREINLAAYATDTTAASKLTATGTVTNNANAVINVGKAGDTVGSQLSAKSIMNYGEINASNGAKISSTASSQFSNYGTINLVDTEDLEHKSTLTVSGSLQNLGGTLNVTKGIVNPGWIVNYYSGAKINLNNAEVNGLIDRNDGTIKAVNTTFKEVKNTNVAGYGPGTFVVLTTNGNNDASAITGNITNAAEAQFRVNAAADKGDLTLSTLKAKTTITGNISNAGTMEVNTATITGDINNTGSFTAKDTDITAGVVQGEGTKFEVSGTATVKIGSKTNNTVTGGLSTTINVADGANLTAEIYKTDAGKVVFDAKTNGQGILLADKSVIMADIENRNANLRVGTVADNVFTAGKLTAGDITNGIEPTTVVVDRAMITAGSINAVSLTNNGTVGSQEDGKKLDSLTLTGALDNKIYSNVYVVHKLKAGSIENAGGIDVGSIETGELVNKTIDEKKAGLITATIIDAASIDNAGNINAGNKGTITTTGTLTNSGTIENAGTLYVGKTASATEPVTYTYTGVLNNTGAVTADNIYAGLVSNGTSNAESNDAVKIISESISGASISNYGTIEAKSIAIDAGGDGVKNAGTIKVIGGEGTANAGSFNVGSNDADNTNGTIELNNAVLSGGVIRKGTINAKNGSVITTTTDYSSISLTGSTVNAAQVDATSGAKFKVLSSTEASELHISTFIGTIELENGAILKNSDVTRYKVASYAAAVTIADGANVTFTGTNAFTKNANAEDGAKFNFTNSGTLTVNATLPIDAANLTVDGTFVNNGTITIDTSSLEITGEDPVVIKVISFAEYEGSLTSKITVDNTDKYEVLVNQDNISLFYKGSVPVDKSTLVVNHAWSEEPYGKEVMFGVEKGEPVYYRVGINAFDSANELINLTEATKKIKFAKSTSNNYGDLTLTNSTDITVWDSVGLVEGGTVILKNFTVIGSGKDKTRLNIAESAPADTTVRIKAVNADDGNVTITNADVDFDNAITAIDGAVTITGSEVEFDMATSIGGKLTIDENSKVEADQGGVFALDSTTASEIDGELLVSKGTDATLKKVTGTGKIYTDINSKLSFTEDTADAAFITSIDVTGLTKDAGKTFDTNGRALNKFVADGTHASKDIAKYFRLAKEADVTSTITVGDLIQVAGACNEITVTSEGDIADALNHTWTVVDSNNNSTTYYADNVIINCANTTGNTLYLLGNSPDQYVKLTGVNTFVEGVYGGKYKDKTAADTGRGGTNLGGDIKITIDGTNIFNKAVVGGDRIDTTGATKKMNYYRENADESAATISLTINGGTFKNYVAAGMLYQGDYISGSVDVGNTHLTITAGNFTAVDKGIFGGNFASKKAGSVRTTVSGKSSVTIEAGKGDIIMSGSALYVGSYGAGAVGETELTFTGKQAAGQTLKFKQIWGGSSSDKIIRDSKATGNGLYEGSVSGDRTLSFTGFEGSIDCKSIAGFSDVIVSNSVAKLNAGDMSAVENWDFSMGSKLEGAFTNDFVGDTFTFGTATDDVTGFSSWTVFEGMGDLNDTFGGFRTDTSVTTPNVKLFGETAIWNGAAYESDNYMLSLNTQNGINNVVVASKMV